MFDFNVTAEEVEGLMVPFQPVIYSAWDRGCLEVVEDNLRNFAIGIGVAGVVIGLVETEEIEERMNDAFTAYTSGPDAEDYMEDVNDVVAYVQRTFKCCGVNDSRDWVRSQVFEENGFTPPAECNCEVDEDDNCEMFDFNVTAEEVEGLMVPFQPVIYSAWDRGCLEVVEDNLRNFAIGIGVAGVVIGLVETEEIEERMNDAFTAYTSGPDAEDYMEDVNDVVAYVQRTFKCCGVNDSRDWVRSQVFEENGFTPPAECNCEVDEDDNCEMFAFNVTAEEVEGLMVPFQPVIYSAWDRGCLEVVEDNLRNFAIGIGVAGVVIGLVETEEIEERMNDAFTAYTSGPDAEDYMEDVNDVVAYVQRTFKCCGVNDSRDWVRSQVFEENGFTPPAECNCEVDEDDNCEMFAFNVTAEEVEGLMVPFQPVIYSAWDRGCLEVVEDNLRNFAIGIGVAGVVIGLVEIIGILVSVGLVVCIFKARKDTYV
jgi:hypothetical protein